ncbi:MAG: hypothetical protein ACTHL8_08695 [Burkholderiaceae bacterium]
MTSTTALPDALTAEFVGRPGDFAFLAGRWQVTNRRLRERGVGCTEWDTIPAVNEGWSLMNGQISVDEITFEGQPLVGSTFRTLDVAAGRWAIYWVSSRDGRLQPPVHGGWSGDRGMFVGDDRDGDRPIRVRFLWERLGADAARWSQDFAPIDADGALAGPWETNWIMDFRRLPR